MNRIVSTVPPWGLEARDALVAALAAPSYPCTMGQIGLRRGELRFHFSLSSTDVGPLSEALGTYLAGDLGNYTTFVAMFPPDPHDGDHASNEAWFWSTLQRLHATDPARWVGPIDPEAPNFEFSYAGKSVFVTAMMPSHTKRRSRRASVRTVLFQPRHIFGGARSTQKIRDLIRGRLLRYDLTPPSPTLGVYGDSGHREWREYFLLDTNGTVRRRCPLDPNERHRARCPLGGLGRHLAAGAEFVRTWLHPSSIVQDRHGAGGVKDGG